MTVRHAVHRAIAAFSGAMAICLCWSSDTSAASPMPEAIVPPVTPACISSPFGPRYLAGLPIPNAFHNGIDLPASWGHPVQAVARGQIIRIQRKGPGGLEMLIQHDGFIGIYSHLGLITPMIAEGARTIQAGERIGTVGHSGLTLGPHLFFAMIVGDRAVDPAQFLHILPCHHPSLSSETRIRPTRYYPDQ